MPHGFAAAVNAVCELLEGYDERLDNGESGRTERSDWLGRRVASIGDASRLADGQQRTWKPLTVARGEYERNLQRWVARYMNRLDRPDQATIEEAFFERAPRSVRAERAGLKTKSATTRRLETSLRRFVRAAALEDQAYLRAELEEETQNRRGLAEAWFDKPYSELTEDERREYRRRYKAEVQRARQAAADERAKDGAWRNLQGYLNYRADLALARSLGYQR